MSAGRIFVSGVGIVTPLGCDVGEVSRRMAHGERGRRVERFDILDFTPSERLRRSPSVSLFAVAAAARAIESAGLVTCGLAAREASVRDGEDRHVDRAEAPSDPARADRGALADLDPARVAVIAAISKGAMNYSIRFHGQFVKGGAKAVVPLLFPETVANAPASHVASVFGLSGPNATLMGDAAVAYNAIAMARDFLEWGLADAVLVVAPHENALTMEEAYARFRWVFRGAPFSEGAAAILLTRSDTGRGEILHIDRGFPYRRRQEVPSCVARALRDLPAKPEVVSVSGNETLPFPSAERVAVKDSLGEAFAAGALWQVVFGLDRAVRGQCVLASCVGLSQQVSVVLARR